MIVSVCGWLMVTVTFAVELLSVNELAALAKLTLGTLAVAVS